MEHRVYKGLGVVYLLGEEYKSESGQSIFLIILTNIQTEKSQLMQLCFNQEDFDKSWDSFANFDTVQDFEVQ